MMTRLNKIEVLKTALEARINEVLEYQINIDNYERAIVKVDSEFNGDGRLVDFRNNLVNNLEASKVEQLKAKIILEVIKDQLTEAGETL